MSNSQYENHGGHRRSGAGQSISEAQLRIEIGFWRDMIASCGDTEPSDFVERMHHALALAERRLEQLRRDQPSNVFSISGVPESQKHGREGHTETAAGCRFVNRASAADKHRDG